MLAAISRLIDRIEGFAMVVLILTATIVAVVQVAARYVFNNSLYWSEELILYALISMSFLAASMGVRHSAHISVEAVFAFVGPRTARVLKLVSAVLGMVFAGALAYYGWVLFSNTNDMGQLSPAMQIPVAYIYLTIPISAVLMFVRYLEQAVRLVQGQQQETISLVSAT
ncbi:MAG TPA: TRAP transporter small permease [Noviherbaspirillum sp.]